jgi:hypothetical protein
MLLSLAISGCVTTRNSAEPLGVKVGDPLLLRTAAAVTACQAWQSTAAMWFSSPPAAHCLSQFSDESDAQSSSAFPVGTRFNVVRVRYSNQFDEAHFLVYVVAASASAQDQLLVRDYEFAKLFRVAQANEP